jgi:hypothetical protein
MPAIKEHEMGGKMIKLFTELEVKIEQPQPLCRRENIIKMNLK